MNLRNCRRFVARLGQRPNKSQLFPKMGLSPIFALMGSFYQWAFRPDPENFLTALATFSYFMPFTVAV